MLLLFLSHSLGSPNERNGFLMGLFTISCFRCRPFPGPGTKGGWTMYRRYLGISAVALAGLIALADNAAAQEKRQGSGERREGASSGERREGANAAERREGERLDPGARVEGEFRSG